MFEKLIQELKKYNSVALGFSGGVDSSLLAYALQQSGVHYCAVTVRTCLQSKREIAQSVVFCREFGIRQQIIDLEVAEDVLANSKERCYLCKKEVFQAIVRFANRQQYDAVIDGSQVGDRSGYRPGQKALEELGVKSPLMALGWDKKTIREISRELRLPTAKAESATCLATRVPYGSHITKEMLLQIEEAEKLFGNAGLASFRCRHHGALLRLEAKDVDQAFELAKKYQQELKTLGFRFVTVDVAGYQKGCYDETN